MALWICKECTAAYAVGLPACPQCGSTTHTTKQELEATMPKINRRGPSYEPGTEPATEPQPTKPDEQPGAALAEDAAPQQPPASPPPAPGK